MRAVLAIDELGAGRPLVLVHGLGTSRGVWRHVTGSLAENALVMVPDLPGFGDSPPAGPGFELGAVADRLAAELCRRAGEPFELVGHSLGGAVAVALARRHPRAIRALVLMAPAGFAPRGPLVAGALARGARPFLAARGRVGSVLAGSPTARRLLLWGTVADARRLPEADARFMLAASARATRLREALETVLACDLADDLERLTVPVGLIWGERDRVVPVAAGERLARALPRIPLERIEDAGHVPQLERPRAYLAALGRVREALRSVTA